MSRSLTIAVSGTGAGSAQPAVLKSITVSPTSATISAGETQQFTATGHYSDNGAARISRRLRRGLPPTAKRLALRHGFGNRIDRRHSDHYGFQRRGEQSRRTSNCDGCAKHCNRSSSPLRPLRSVPEKRNSLRPQATIAITARRISRRVRRGLPPTAKRLASARVWRPEWQRAPRPSRLRRAGRAVPA